MTDHKLILLSMVKNETRIIERLMGSVKGRVDAIVICDTGSTDDTVDKATAWLTTNDISGTVCAYTFKNFGVSRTQSFICCQDWVNRVGWDATKTWALVLDGDMMLSGPIDRNPLASLGPEQAGVSLKKCAASLL